MNMYFTVEVCNLEEDCDRSVIADAIEEALKEKFPYNETAVYAEDL